MAQQDNFNYNVLDAFSCLGNMYYRMKSLTTVIFALGIALLHLVHHGGGFQIYRHLVRFFFAHTHTFWFLLSNLFRPEISLRILLKSWHTNAKWDRDVRALTAKYVKQLENNSNFSCVKMKLETWRRRGGQIQINYKLYNVISNGHLIEEIKQCCWFAVCSGTLCRCLLAAIVNKIIWYLYAVCARALFTFKWKINLFTAFYWIYGILDNDQSLVGLHDGKSMFSC